MSAIRADGVHQVRVYIYIHISFSLGSTLAFGVLRVSLNGADKAYTA